MRVSWAKHWLSPNIIGRLTYLCSLYLRVSVSLLTRLSACMPGRWLEFRPVYTLCILSHSRAFCIAHFLCSLSCFLSRSTLSYSVHMVDCDVVSFSVRLLFFIGCRTFKCTPTASFTYIVHTHVSATSKANQSIILYIVHLLKICRYTYVYTHAHRIEAACVFVFVYRYRIEKNQKEIERENRLHTFSSVWPISIDTIDMKILRCIVLRHTHSHTQRDQWEMRMEWVKYRRHIYYAYVLYGLKSFRIDKMCIALITHIGQIAIST